MSRATSAVTMMAGFEGKTMAVVGTILHGVWTLLLIGSVFLQVMVNGP